MAKHLDSSAYTVGWVCAIREEVTASRALLDEEHERPPKQPNDDNNYIVGRMEKHNVVIAFPGAGSYGADAISHTAAHMVRSFQSLRFGLMVGIGGGAPSAPDSANPLNDIRLGDVVVSEPKGNHGGVLQYDKGRWKESGLFEIRSHLNRPPKILLSAMTLLQVDHEIGQGRMLQYFDDVGEKSNKLRTWGFRFPGRDLDRLFKANHPHAGGKDCSGCGTENLEQRLERPDDEPVVHYGLIASANAVMRSAVYRDKLRDTWGACCFEMEAAGLMNDFPCLIIRGIADYSDDHKNDLWQRYAAAMAAAYTKDLLRIIQPEEVQHAEMVVQIASNLSKTLDRVEINIANVTELIEDDQATKILDWLSPIDYGTEQSDFLDQRQQGTGQWLLNSDQFQHWYKNRGQILLFQGIPGAGKTIMAAAVNDYISNKQRSDSDLGLAFVFCNFRRKHQQKPINILASILKQLARQDKRVLKEVKSLHARHTKMKTRRLQTEVISALGTVGDCFKQTYVVIDALDETQIPRKQLLVFLSELFRIQKRIGLNLLVTSRISPEIEKLFVQRKASLLEVRATDDDVRSFVQGNISQLPSFVTESTVNTITEQILRAADGIFLLARLHLDSLQDKVSPRLMDAALDNLPSGSDAYEEAYKEAMVRIEGQKSGFRNLAIQALSWIASSRRPMTTRELQHALAIKKGERSFDKRSIVEVTLISSVCAGLIAVDEKSKIIRLVHYTAQEFFDRSWKQWFADSHRDIADACITYLSYDGMGTEEFQRNLPQYVLYAYSARNWGYHAQLQSVDETLAFRLLEDHAKMSSAGQQLVLEACCCDSHTLDGPKKISSVHLTSYFGLENLTRGIFRRGGDITGKDAWGRSALTWAAVYGHRGLVEYLIGCGLKVDLMDNFSMTPLIWAIINGHGETAKLLLEREKGELSKASADQVELICEARMGHRESVEALLDQGAKPDCQYGEYAPLQLAARHGHYSVARVLLEHGANPNLQDAYGRAALHRATSSGTLDIVRLLLEYGAKVDMKDYSNQTPLALSLYRSHESVIESLLEFGADPDLKDGHGNFALIEAVRSGSNVILDIVLRGGANLNLQDSNGGTALICAAVDKRKEMVRLLLAFKPQLDLRDVEGRTALIWAVVNGCDSMVDMLLQSGADPDVEDHKRKTALLLAIMEDRKSIALALIKSGANLDKKDSNGGFALIWAVRRNLGTVVDRLLQESPDLNLQDPKGGTALICAAVEKRDHMVRLLLTSYPRLNLRDCTGSTALVWAARNKCIEIVRMLLESGADPDIPDNDANTALSWAIRNGDEEVANILLQSGNGTKVARDDGEMSRDQRDCYQTVTHDGGEISRDQPDLHQTVTHDDGEILWHQRDCREAVAQPVLQHSSKSIKRRLKNIFS